MTWLFHLTDPLPRTPSMVPEPEPDAVEPSAAGRRSKAKGPKDLPCPFSGCPDSKGPKSKGALLSHLARCHVAAGQAVDEDTLAWLGASVCSSCRSIWKGVTPCRSCAGRAGSANPRGRSQPQESADFPRRAAPDMLLPVVGGTPMTSACPAFAPTFEEIMGAQVPTMRHLPSGCRHEFADLLGQLLLRVARHPTWEAAYALVALPKMVLGTCNRRGRQHVRQVQLAVARRLSMFAEGRIAELWAEATSRMPKGPKPRTRTRECAGGQ